MVYSGVRELLHHTFGIRKAEITDLRTPVNDILRVDAGADSFALKLYNVRSRPAAVVGWELDLLAVLGEADLPIAKPVAGTANVPASVMWQGTERAAVLYHWAPGTKPTPGTETYRILGNAAARIHAASTGFTSPHPRERYDRAMLIDIQLERLQIPMRQAGVWQQFSALAERMRTAINDPELDFGVCHMDLTLDNIHIHEGQITIFDFDSAAESWRANEAHAVLRFSQEYFGDWLTGYRTVRPFALKDEQAVWSFGIIGDIRNVSWKLGLAESSRGAPLIGIDALPEIVDDWLAWEARIPRATQ